MCADYTVWQVCDSAFPAGAFAHSGGLEAAWQAGEVVGTEGLSAWVNAALRQAAAGAVPVVSAAWHAPDSLPALDALYDSFLLNHVANRASRAQGQAFVKACDSTFDVVGVRQVAAALRGRRLAGHWPSVFGTVCRALDVPRRRAAEMVLFLTLRGAVSSAVRLGILGPLQAQRLQHASATALDTLVDRYLDVPPEAIAQTAPLADLFQAAHVRLYSRLFVS